VSAFFDIVRKEIFGGKMTPGQVNGIETLLAATDGLDIGDRAYLLATSFHETAHTMQPITEYGPRKYFDKYEPNTAIGRRLGNARPGDGYLFRGRGYVQITGRANYLRASQKLGVDLIINPDAALNPEVAARILVKGCSDGWFTGKKLSDYSDYVNMRRVVNGTDRAEQIAGYAREFEKALRFLPVSQPVVIPEPPISPPAVAPSWFAAFLTSLLGIMKGTGK
jgi:hypothetical protein